MLRSQTRRRPGRLLPLAALPLAVACASQAPEPILTGPVRHFELDLAPAGDDLERAAADYLRGFRSELGLSPDDDFAILSVREGLDGLRHARMRQAHGGLPVWGSEVAVHASDSVFLAFSGTVTTGLATFDVRPGLPGEQALSLAREDLRASLPSAPAELRSEDERATLVILPSGEAGASLAWHVEFSTRSAPGVPFGLWEAFVDAGSGRILGRHSAIHTATLASGPGGNPNRSWYWDRHLEVTRAGDDAGIRDFYLMKSDRQETYDIGGSENYDAELIVRRLDEFDDPAANDAHGFSRVTLDMMDEWMGLSSIDGAGMVISSVVNNGDPCYVDNAFWSRSANVMVYGAGDRLYPMSGALDVVAHEMAHGFTQYHSGLTYRGMASALNESFSDVAGVVAEVYWRGETTMEIGADIAPGSEAFRYMCDPPADGWSIDHVRDYEELLRRERYREGNECNPWPYEGAHHASGIPNKAFCTAARRLDDVRRVGELWYAANAGYWISTTTFNQACTSIIDAARALGFTREEIDVIRSAWEEVGVYCGAEPTVCNQNDRCDVGAGETCFTCPDECGGCREACGRFRRALCSLRLANCSSCPTTCGDGACAGDETAESCPEDCGCSAPTAQCGSVAPGGCWCSVSAVCEAHEDCCPDASLCDGE